MSLQFWTGVLSRVLGEDALCCASELQPSPPVVLHELGRVMQFNSNWGEKKIPKVNESMVILYRVF